MAHVRCAAFLFANLLFSDVNLDRPYYLTVQGNLNSFITICNLNPFLLVLRASSLER